MEATAGANTGLGILERSEARRINRPGLKLSSRSRSNSEISRDPGGRDRAGWSTGA
jgi:hypothetical protein